jgi:hypothetical protein
MLALISKPSVERRNLRFVHGVYFDSESHITTLRG